MSQTIKPRVPRIDWSVPLTRGLTLDVPLFEMGGSTVKDLVSGKPLSLLASPTFVPGQLGRGVNYTGSTTNQAISLFTPCMSVIDNWALESWVVPTFPGGDGAETVICVGDAQTGYAMMLGGAFDAGGTGFLGLFNNVAWIDPGLTLTSGVLVHLVFMRRAGAALFYINGQNETQSGFNTPNTPANDTSLGASNTGGGTYNRRLTGSQYTARAWNRALTQNEIAQLFTNPFAIYKQPKTVAANAIASFTWQQLQNIEQPTNERWEAVGY